MLASMDYIKKIKSGLALLSKEVEASSCLNLLDINIHAETFYCGLLNIIFDYNLVNLNSIKQNAKSIDLGDLNKGISIQVTSTASLKKIKDTVDGFIESKLYSSYKRLFIMNLTTKSNYRLDKYGVNGVFEIDLKTDVWDYKDLLKHIHGLDISKMKEICEFFDRTLKFPEQEKAPKEVKTLLAMIELLSNDDNPLAGNGFTESPNPENKIYKRFRDHKNVLIGSYVRLAPIYSSILKEIQEQSDIGLLKIQKMGLYLENQSDAVLTSRGGDPLLALGDLKSYYSNQISKNDIEYDDCAIEFFLIDSLIKCNVFPNKEVV